MPDPVKAQEVVTLFIENIEPVWVEYHVHIDIPAEAVAGMSDEEIKGNVMEYIEKYSYVIDSGPDVVGEIEGMDQEWNPQEIERATLTRTWEK